MTATHSTMDRTRSLRRSASSAAGSSPRASGRPRLDGHGVHRARRWRAVAGPASATSGGVGGVGHGRSTVAGEDARGGAAPGAAQRARGAVDDRAPRARGSTSSRSSHGSAATARVTTERAVRPCLGRLHRVGLAHPAGARAPGRATTRGSSSSARNTAGDERPAGGVEARRRAGRRAAIRSTRNRRSPPRQVAVPEQVEAAVLGVEQVRVDVALGAGVASVGVVVEVDAAVLSHRRRAARRAPRPARRRGRCRAPGRRRRRARPASLATPAASAPSGSAPGRASTEAPAVRRATAWSGVSRCGGGEHLGVVDPDPVALLHDVDRARPGVYGGRPDQPDHLEVGGQLRRGDPEALARPRRRVGPSWAAIHGTIASRRWSRAPDGLGGGHRRPRSSQATRSSRSSGGSRISAWSRNDSTNERKAARLVTGSSTTTDPSVLARRRTWSGPTCWTAHRACAASIRTRRRDGLLAAQLPRAAGSAGDGGRPARRRAGSSSDRHRALDPVEAEVPLLAAEVVVAGEVPAAPLELEAVGVDRAGPRRGSGASTGVRADDGPEEHGQVRVGRQRGDVDPEVAARGVRHQAAELEEARRSTGGPRPAPRRRPGAARPARRW